MFDYNFFLAVCICSIIMLTIGVNWLYQCKNNLVADFAEISKKVSRLEGEVESFPVVTTKLIEDKMQPIEQALADVRGFTQTIDINIRLLIDKIDLAVKHNEQQ